jgi:peptide-methionine (S)-S-oxide reductase
MNRDELVVGGGCFWCLETMFRELRGVIACESGYAGGASPNVDYKQVCSGTTGHAEVIKITFDSSTLTRADLLRLFLVAHDPTQLNRQGNDVGHQYRSVIFSRDAAEEAEAQAVIDETQEKGFFKDPIVTTLEHLSVYVKAEDYHQGYYDRFENGNILDRMTMNAGYCSAVVGPKVSKFRKEFAAYLKA